MRTIGFMCMTFEANHHHHHLPSISLLRPTFYTIIRHAPQVYGRTYLAPYFHRAHRLPTLYLSSLLPDVIPYDSNREEGLKVGAYNRNRRMLGSHSRSSNSSSSSVKYGVSKAMKCMSGCYNGFYQKIISYWAFFLTCFYCGI